MVAEQLAGRGIVDERVLGAMGRVPRELFVSERDRRRAYRDMPLPIGHGQTISQPFMVAVICQAAAVEDGDRVLDIGTGSGYQAAVLSRLAREVVSIERYRTLADMARVRLRELGYDNVDVVVGDGFAGVPSRAPYDRIIVTAAAERLPETLLDQLANGGVMILPLGSHDGSQHLIKLTKSQTGARRENLIPVRFVPMLPGQAQEL